MSGVISGSKRLLSTLSGVLLLVAACACYEYRPLETAGPVVGEPVALQITDRGRVQLSERFGPGLSEIRGRLVSNADNQYVVNVDRVWEINGASTAWSGEETRLDQSLVGMVRGRQLSTTRTVLLSGLGAGLAYFMVTRSLEGHFRQDRDTTPPIDPPLSNRRPGIRVRIPLGIRF
jgi:hypothetical protein